MLACRSLTRNRRTPPPADIRANPDDAAIVSSTVSLSKQLGLSVIAEGIENQTTADLLVSMGCEEGQGYFFGRPMPAREFAEKFLAAYPSLFTVVDKEKAA